MEFYGGRSCYLWEMCVTWLACIFLLKCFFSFSHTLEVTLDDHYIRLLQFMSIVPDLGGRARVWLTRGQLRLQQAPHIQKAALLTLTSSSSRCARVKPVSTVPCAYQQAPSFDLYLWKLPRVKYLWTSHSDCSQNSPVAAPQCCKYFPPRLPHCLLLYKQTQHMYPRKNKDRWGFRFVWKHISLCLQKWKVCWSSNDATRCFDLRRFSSEAAGRAGTLRVTEKTTFTDCDSRERMSRAGISSLSRESLPYRAFHSDTIRERKNRLPEETCWAGLAQTKARKRMAPWHLGITSLGC